MSQASAPDEPQVGVVCGLVGPVSLKHDGPTGHTTGQRGSDPSALLQAN